MTESETLDEPALTSDQQEATTDEEDDETCPNGSEWCDGGDGDQLPCFACFQDARLEERE